MKFTHFIGIDVSKKTFNAAFLSLGMNAIRAESCFDNTAKGFKLFYRWVIEHLGKSELSQLLICMEHTGLYDLELSLFLHQKALAYSHRNAVEIKHSMGINRGKSDRMDARRIAFYIRKERDEPKLSIPAPRSLLQLHRLFSARELIVKQNKALKQHNKALEAIKDDPISKRIQKDHLKISRLLQQRIKALEKQMKALIVKDQALAKNYELLLSVPGIGPLNATYFLITTKNFEGFCTWRQYATYAGTAPHEHSSGTSLKGKNRVNHFANKKAKALLTSAATSAKRNHYEIRSFFEKKTKEGKPNFWIINAIRNKIISRAFAVIDRQNEYKSVDHYQKWKQEKQAA